MKRLDFRSTNGQQFSPEASTSSKVLGCSSSSLYLHLINDYNQINDCILDSQKINSL